MSSSLTDKSNDGEYTDYKTYEIDLVRQYHTHICDICAETSARASGVLDGVAYVKDGKHEHQQDFPNSTWLYGYYNFFSCNTRDNVVYDLFAKVKECIRDYIGMDERAWTQCWVNTHPKDGLLQKHFHQYPIHWYLSIYPQTTATVFYEGDMDDGPEIYRINNEVGKLYIGPGDRTHEVVPTGEFDRMPRITIAGNVLRSSDTQYQCKTFSFVPI